MGHTEFSYESSYGALLKQECGLVPCLSCLSLDFPLGTL